MNSEEPLHATCKRTLKSVTHQNLNEIIDLAAPKVISHRMPDVKTLIPRKTTKRAYTPHSCDRIKSYHTTQMLNYLKLADPARLFSGEARGVVKGEK